MKLNQINHIQFYNFNTDFTTTSNILCNLTLQSHLLQFIEKTISNLPIIQKGDTSWEEGTEFSIYFENRITFFFRMEKLIITDYYSQIFYSAYKTIPPSFTYQFMLTLHNMSHSHSLVISNFSYDSKANVPEYMIPIEQRRRRRMMQNLEKRIIDLDYLKVNIEQISIHCPMKIVWEILLNMKSLHKYAKLLGESIEYEGNAVSNQIDVKLIMKDKCVIKGRVSEMSEGKSECQSVIEYLDSIMPIKNVKLMLYANGNDKCEFYMIDIYKRVIYSDEMRFISKNKQKILEKIKKIVSNYYLSLNHNNGNGNK